MENDSNNPSFAAMGRECAHITEKGMETIREIDDPNSPVGKRKRFDFIDKLSASLPFGDETLPQPEKPDNVDW